MITRPSLEHLPVASWARLLLLPTLIALTAALGLGQSSVKREPVPSLAAQDKARLMLHKLFQKDYARLQKDAAAVVPFGELLLKEGRATSDDSLLRYVAFDEVRGLAEKYAEIKLAFAAIGDLADHYLVDGLDLKIKTMLAIGRATKVKEAREKLLDVALPLAGEAVATDKYELALLVLETGDNLAQELGDKAAVARLEERVNQVYALRKEYSKVQAAFATLVKDGDDADAHLQVGIFLALTKGDWAKGLPHLAKGANPRLKAQAQAELAVPKRPEDFVALGDGWWDLGDLADGSTKDHYLKHAAQWYKKALPQLSGDARLRVQKRLEQVLGEIPADLTPVPVGEMRRFLGHTSGIAGLAWSKDRKRAYSGAWDRSIRVWDIDTGKELQQLLGHNDSINSVTLSPDESQLLSGSNDKSMRLWDTKSGKELKQILGHTSTLTCVLFLPGGNKALSSSLDRSIRLWNLDTAQELSRYEGHTHEVNNVSLSPKGGVFLSVSSDGTLRKWDLNAPKELAQWSFGTPLYWVSYSPDGSQALLAGQDHKVRLVDPDTGKIIRLFEGHTDTNWSVAFSPDGSRALSASADNSVRLWDVATGKTIQVFQGHNSMALRALFSHDGRLGLSSDSTQAVILWGLPPM